MITLNVLIFTLVLAKDIRISHSLMQDGENVCSKRSLVKVVDIYPTTWAEDWDCETSYPATTCERIRSSAIDINSVYFVKEDLICCPGWLLSENDEDECRQSCPTGYYGENCMYECRCFNGRKPNRCNAEDGSCDCLDGLTGRECDQRCSPGYFGPNCSRRSPFTCMNGGTNHPVTGQCLCRTLYDGPICEIDCGGIEQFDDCGIIVCANCRQNSTCDLVLNTCSCRDGWRGRYCSDPCDIGTRGLFCAELCCSGRGYCTGESCICPDGYLGDECQHKCEDGTFGKNCKETCKCPSCNYVTGNCDLCPIGFTGSRCTERCLPSQWGESCNLTCLCEEDEACDVFTGECTQTSTGSLLWLLVVALVLLLFVGVGSVYFVCSRSSKKVQHEDDQKGAAQNDNYSTIGGNSSWSGGDYQGLRDIHTTYGQFNQTTDQIYNAAYQSTNVDTNTNMEEGVYNSVEVSTKDRPKVKNPIKTRFNNPVYNIDEVLATKPKNIAQQPNEFEDYHPYEDLGHDYDNAVFTQKP